VVSGVADKFIADVRKVTAECMADPESCDKGSAAIYGMAQAIPDRSIVDQITW
jgi:sphinganine-1-phosphate aldolase